MNTTPLADPIEMQHQLFAELSQMYAREAPLYDRSLLVNRLCNTAVCELLGLLHIGFTIDEAQIERTSRERHGAIRIGREDEFRWITRFFALFGMAPHNFYDMTSVGEKSQPVVATAFRSVDEPEHRIFVSLLQLDCLDDDAAQRVGELLSQREVFPARARELVEKAEAQSGLGRAEANELIRLGVDRIFHWTGRGRDHTLYTELCDSGLKFAADIACFDTHHLNHLTPNTFCMDLYTTCMKWRLGEIDEATWRRRSLSAATALAQRAAVHFMRLHFRHLTWDEIESFRPGSASGEDIDRIIEHLAGALRRPELDLTALPHAGFKKTTEGPPADTPILLRQDSYRALTEPVVFSNPDGAETRGAHTARFGEIEERFYAVTPKGRELYDRCLAEAEAVAGRRHEFEAREAAYADAFRAFPKTLTELLGAGLVYVRCEPTAQGLAAARDGAIDTTDLLELHARGLVRIEGLRYEDFLPVSAAGIFASNLNQSGIRPGRTRDAAAARSAFEAIIGRGVIDADRLYRARSAMAQRETLGSLGLLERLDPDARARLESDAACLESEQDASNSPDATCPV